LATSLSGSTKTNTGAKDALPRFYRYLAGASKLQERDQQDLAIQAYVALLRTPYARETFWDMKEETVAPLARLLEETAGGTAGSDRASVATGTVSGIVQGGVPLQLVYHVLLAVWELTFDDTVAEEINE
jgi:V-type H+-transporting ATPase subunit H